MSISSVPSSLAPAALPKTPATESSEPTAAGRDVTNDGDSDDAAPAAAASTQPTVNTLGQEIGKHLNVTA
jgi:hypothetical protein